MKANSKGGIAAVIILMFLIGVPVDLMAQQQQQQEPSALQTIPLRFQPYITTQEMYDSNIFLTATNRTADWITTVTPGIRIGQQDAFTGINLDVNGGYNWYANNSDLNFWSALGNLEARYSPSRYWNFRLREYILRSEDPQERQYGGQYNQMFSSIDQTRSIYIRNVVTPSIEYRFARDSSLGVAYTNNYYDNENPGIEDSISNAITPTLNYWFDVRNGILLQYTYSAINYDVQSDQTSNYGRARYTHRFNPMTSVFGEYIYEVVDFDSPGVDYTVNSPSAGIEHAFSRSLSGLLQVGWFWQDPDVGDTFDGPTINSNLTLRGERTTYTVYALGGYREEYQTSENLGFIKYYRGGATISHRLLRHLTIGLDANVEWDDYATEEEAWLYTASLNMTYQLIRWMNITTGVAYSENDSNIEPNDYTDWRGFVSLTMTYGEGTRPAPASAASGGTR